MFWNRKPLEGKQEHEQGSFRIRGYADGTWLVDEYDIWKGVADDYYTWGWYHAKEFKTEEAARQYIEDQKARRIKKSEEIVPA